MSSRIGRVAFIVIGVVCVVVGVIFAGQGLNLIPGSFMTGVRMWFYIGLVVAIVGIVLVSIGLRRPRGGRARSNR
jgi:hypothetical protein